MSYNDSPEWTKYLTLPDIKEMKCPTCGEVARNAGSCSEVISENGYYEPRHIPPYLVLTCSNPECSCCDQDYSVELQAVVTIRRIVSGFQLNQE